MRQSKELTEFYRAYLAWVERGAPERSGGFSRMRGLCSCIPDELRNEMIAQFREAGLCWDYPFGGVNYTDRKYARTQHECPKRLAWVREYAFLDETTKPQEQRKASLWQRLKTRMGLMMTTCKGV